MERIFQVPSTVRRHSLMKFQNSQRETIQPNSREEKTKYKINMFYANDQGSGSQKTMKQYFYMSERRQFPTQQFRTQLNFIKKDGKAFSVLETQKTISYKPSFRKLLLNVFQQNRNEPRKGKVQSQRWIQIKGELKGIPRKW